MDSIVDLSLCKKCKHLSFYTGYEKKDETAKQENWKILVCNIDGKTMGIESLDDKGEDTNMFMQEPDSKTPLGCPYLLEHTIKSDNIKKNDLKQLRKGY